MDTLQKANQMLRFKKIDEILSRPITPEKLINLKETFKENREIPLLQRIALHLLESNSNEQVIKALSQELNLNQVELRFLEKIVQNHKIKISRV